MTGSIPRRVPSPFAGTLILLRDEGTADSKEAPSGIGMPATTLDYLLASNPGGKTSRKSPDIEASDAQLIIKCPELSG